MVIRGNSLLLNSAVTLKPEETQMTIQDQQEWEALVARWRGIAESELAAGNTESADAARTAAGTAALYWLKTFSDEVPEELQSEAWQKALELDHEGDRKGNENNRVATVAAIYAKAYAQRLALTVYETEGLRGSA
jgi:hypothetical protein